VILKLIYLEEACIGVSWKTYDALGIEREVLNNTARHEGLIEGGGTYRVQASGQRHADSRSGGRYESREVWIWRTNVRAYIVVTVCARVGL
jgi:hypothetical protein